MLSHILTTIKTPPVCRYRRSDGAWRLGEPTPGAPNHIETSDDVAAEQIYVPAPTKTVAPQKTPTKSASTKKTAKATSKKVSSVASAGEVVGEPAADDADPDQGTSSEQVSTSTYSAPTTSRDFLFSRRLGSSRSAGSSCFASRVTTYIAAPKASNGTLLMRHLWTMSSARVICKGRFARTATLMGSFRQLPGAAPIYPILFQIIGRHPFLRSHFPVDADSVATACASANCVGDMRSLWRYVHYFASKCVIKRGRRFLCGVSLMIRRRPCNLW